jgi:hypothetical protein
MLCIDDVNETPNLLTIFSGRLCGSQVLLAGAVACLTWRQEHGAFFVLVCSILLCASHKANVNEPNGAGYDSVSH